MTLIAFARIVDTRRRVERIMWAARSEAIARQLRAMRATAL